MPYTFEPDELLSEAFARTAREQLEGAETALTTELESDRAAAVHSARKSVKKERALLRLMRGAVNPRERRRQNDALRRATRHLSKSRDAEVMISTLDDLSDRYAGQVPHPVFAVIRERLEADRGADGDGSAEAEVAARLAAIREHMADWQLQRHGWEAIDDGLSRTYQRGRGAFARAQRRPSDENLHAWRKRVKDLWYQLRLLAPVGGGAVRGQSKDAGALADLLGDDHDLAVLRVTLERIGVDVATDLDAVIGLVDHRRGELQAAALSLGERVYAEKPKAFRRRLRQYWRAGRDERHDAEHRDPAELAHITRQPGAH
ncbi:MAG: CHAD domain-containing protein [Solirubrobacteraceae bacterium]